MEQSGGDGSEASYESVASEGAFEPASDRGRDPLPRIISSSHCVEVFRRVRWIDGAYCCRSPDDSEANPGLHDPLVGLPSRLMRFDGAIEAWLEEMPLPRDPHLPLPYTSLNDAAYRQNQPLSILRSGNRRATIWFFTLEFLQRLWPLFLQSDGSGMKLWEQALVDAGCNIQSTHVEVGQVHCPPQSVKLRSAWLQTLFVSMQAANWNPDGEARSLLLKQRLTHASMSIGDAVQIGTDLYVAGITGFVQIKNALALLPPNAVPEPPDEVVEEARPEQKVESTCNGEVRDEGDDRGAENGGEAKTGKKKKPKKKKKSGGGGGEEATVEAVVPEPELEPPAPVVVAATMTAHNGRSDRRGLRAKLQAERERLQGKVA
mmetsp:Transcript_8635/g.24061  ORF Transcript_8635/g.24061 Transcript_8635/m.24061 type:complete len:375 (-) Transcript_8635:387-1511(-)